MLNVDYADNTPDITYTYNRLGKQATIQDAVGTRSFTYNSTFNLIKETINGIYSKVINRTYTTSGMKGRILGVSIGDVQNYVYAYDDYGRINKITTPAGDFNYTRLANSDLLSQMTRPNGVTTTWRYEPNRNLIMQVQNGTISTFDYTNNAIGNRLSMSRSGSAFSTPDTLSYTYNSRGEVTGATSDENAAYNYAFNFDPVGNRLTASLAGSEYEYLTNDLNQYTTITLGNSTVEPTYDSDGNMLTRDGWTQSWNGENRMVQAIKGSVKLQFTYDYMGRRVEKKVYDDDMLIKHTRFVYDKYKLIEELDALSDNLVQCSYTWQPEVLGLDVLLSVYERTLNTAFYYLSDANKNITELTDVEGNVTAHYEYSPFGIQLITNSMKNNFQFGSEFYDSEVKLSYYNFRYYSPFWGRWLSRDPIGEQGGCNLYIYVNNTTVNVSDKLGLHCDDCFKAYEAAVNDAMRKNRICIDTVAEEARILLKALNDAAYSQYQAMLDTIDFELKRSLRYCETIDRSTLWGEVKYGACKDSAYTLAWALSGDASLAYGIAKASVAATILAFETGRLARCGIEFDLNMKAAQIGFDLCQKDYGTDADGCPCP